MRVDELLELVRQQPFRPLRIHLTDGRSYDVRHPDCIMVRRQRVDIGVASDPDTGGLTKVEYLSLIHIVSVEEVPPTGAAPE